MCFTLQVLLKRKSVQVALFLNLYLYMKQVKKEWQRKIKPDRT